MFVETCWWVERKKRLEGLKGVLRPQAQVYVHLRATRVSSVNASAPEAPAPH